MNKKGYSHILDRVAGDQVPSGLNLAPNILARIQQRKGSRMQTRMKLLTAAALAVIVLVVLFVTAPGMAAAIGRWFGYVPSVGFIREGQVRVLAAPVLAARESIKVTVEQVVVDAERTALVYSVDGIPSSADVSKTADQPCPYKAWLRLPDGSPLLASPEGVEGWASGYKHRFDFPPLPAEVNDATLVIDCLFNTRPGAAPENWEIPLHVVPAQADGSAYPVFEIATPTLPTATQPPVENAAAAPAATQTMAYPPTGSPVSPNLTLDQAVQMEDGYLIYATLHWQDTPFASLDVTGPVDLHLLDGNGQEMLYELHYDEQTFVNIDQRQTTFAIKTAPVQAPGPLTVVLDAVSVDLPVEGTTFVFDPGPDPKTGQTWELNQEIKIGEYTLRILSAVAELGGYSFEMTSENGILNASLADLEHPIASGGSGGGSSSPGATFFSVFNYADGRLPEGPVTVTVGSISVRHVQRLAAEWTPPAVSPTQLPIAAGACLTADSWKAALAQPPALPDSLSGLVLASGPLDGENIGKWGLTVFNLESGEKRVIVDAQDGTLSPDGSTLAYSTYTSAGLVISILDLATGQVTPLAGTGNGDFNPVWSPDGRQIVFNRGVGIFDLFINDLNGSEPRPLTVGGVQEWPVGWLADGQQLLYLVPGRENEYTIYQVNVQSGQTEVFSNDNLLALSPDGKYKLTGEKTFGDRWLVYASELDGANPRLLNDSGLWVLAGLFSPDGQWVVAGVSDSDPGETVGALINLSTCQVIPLPEIRGHFLSWVK